jgi:hypothetical protein
MAKNPPKGAGRRGAVRNRTQVMNPVTKHYVKRNSKNGQFMDVKADKKPFKGITKEK